MMEARDCSDMMKGSRTKELQVATRSWKGKEMDSSLSLQMEGAQLTHCFYFLNIYLFFELILFLAVLGLRFCARAFSSCGSFLQN